MMRASNVTSVMLYCWCSPRLHLFLSSISLTLAQTKVGERRTDKVFRAGARTPLWAHERPNLLYLSNVYMIGYSNTLAAIT
jgi:hypothetical protein